MNDVPAFRPFSVASFMIRTMCSLPGSGRWRNGAGAPAAASGYSHATSYDDAQLNELAGSGYVWETR